VTKKSMLRRSREERRLRRTQTRCRKSFSACSCGAPPTQTRPAKCKHDPSFLAPPAILTSHHCLSLLNYISLTSSLLRRLLLQLKTCRQNCRAPSLQCACDDIHFDSSSSPLLTSVRPPSPLLRRHEQDMEGRRAAHDALAAQVRRCGACVLLAKGLTMPGAG
jgi:hypothetical protein